MASDPWRWTILSNLRVPVATSVQPPNALEQRRPLKNPPAERWIATCYSSFCPVTRIPAWEGAVGGRPPPAWTLRPNETRLVIIPHDVIANLPFAALFLGARLCERFACSLMPHLGWLSPWEHRRARPLKAHRFLGVGVSTYAGAGLLPLPGANVSRGGFLAYGNG